MNTIYKYPFQVEDSVRIEMPKGAEILSVQVQRGTPCIWARVDTEQKTEEREFRIFWTGHKIIGNDLLTYIGTFQMKEGSLVFHLFEKSPMRTIQSPHPPHP